MKTTRVLKSNTTALWLSHKTEQQMLWCLLYNTPQKGLELSGNSCWLGEIPVHPSCPHQALCTHLLCDSLWLFHHRIFKADAEHQRLGRSSPPQAECQWEFAVQEGTWETPGRKLSETSAYLTPWHSTRTQQAENPSVISSSLSNLAKLSCWICKRV